MVPIVDGAPDGGLLIEKVFLGEPLWDFGMWSFIPDRPRKISRGMSAIAIPMPPKSMTREQAAAEMGSGG